MGEEHYSIMYGTGLSYRLLWLRESKVGYFKNSFIDDY